MDLQTYKVFIKEYPSYHFIDHSILHDASRILLGEKSNPFQTEGSLYSSIVKSSSAFSIASWADVQEATDLDNVLQNKSLVADLHAFLKAHPVKASAKVEAKVAAKVVVKEENLGWRDEYLKMCMDSPMTPPKKPLRPGPCPWILQKDAPYPRECWNHAYYDPLIVQQLEENKKLLVCSESETPVDKKAIASLHHIRRNLEAKQRQMPAECVWIHPGSLQWDAEWSVTHTWKTLEEQQEKWAIYYTPLIRPTPVQGISPFQDHYGTEIHSYRIGEGTHYRTLVDGSKRDILTAITISTQRPPKPVAPRYPPLPPQHVWSRV